jgi:hypothetical protein
MVHVQPPGRVWCTTCSTRFAKEEINQIIGGGEETHCKCNIDFSPKSWNNLNIPISSFIFESRKIKYLEKDVPRVHIILQIYDIPYFIFNLSKES